MQDIDFSSNTVEWRNIPEDQIKQIGQLEDSIEDNNYIFFMNIRDFKTHKKLSLSPETTIQDAIKKLINFQNEIFMDLTLSDLHCYLSDKKGRQMKNFPPLEMDQKLGEVKYRRFLIAQKGEDIEVLKFPIEEENEKKTTCYCYKQFKTQ